MPAYGWSSLLNAFLNMHVTFDLWKILERCCGSCVSEVTEGISAYSFHSALYFVICSVVPTPWMSSLVPFNDAWAQAGGCKRSLPRYPKSQSRTCYQECGCHSLLTRFNCYKLTVLGDIFALSHTWVLVLSRHIVLTYRNSGKMRSFY